MILRDHSSRVIERNKKVFLNGNLAKEPRVVDVFNHGWWRLAVGVHWWRLVVGDW